MIKPRYGRFTDAYRGGGYMISFGFKEGWLLFAFRLVNWHFYFTKVRARSAFRAYFGPFEIEYYKAIK
jgi:hypothetical protein